jgi:5-methylcytosine-specific restriction endonuclease McrA
MKTIKPNAEYVWKQCEDVLVQRLHFSAVDRVVYTHLVRHSRMEGKVRLRFSIPWLARGVGLSTDTVRQAVRRLVEHGALNLLERSKAGHVVDVRLPMEIPAVRARSIEDRRPMEPGRDVSLEEIDFLQTRTLRGAIHARESGVCFYCLKGNPYRVRCLDHVVPRARKGSNSYRNLVSSCQQCNCQKGERTAEDYLRWLYRKRRLTDAELNERLRALDDLAAGKLRPLFPSGGNFISRIGRPPLNPASLEQHL